MPQAKKKPQVPDTRIKVGRQGAIYQQTNYKIPERAYGSTHEDSEEYEEVTIDRSVAEIIDQINKRVKSPYYSIYCGIIAILFLFISFPLSIISELQRM
jgi:hypothetical protein